MLGELNTYRSKQRPEKQRKMTSSRLDKSEVIKGRTNTKGCEETSNGEYKKYRKLWRSMNDVRKKYSPTEILQERIHINKCTGNFSSKFLKQGLF